MLADKRDARVSRAIRKRDLLLAVFHALVGGMLLLVARHGTPHLSFFVEEPPWYESDFFPIIVACGVFAVVGIWFRSSQGWLRGLLTTLPPYGWLAWYLAGLIRAGENHTYVENAKALMLMAICLGLSGIVLNPLIAALIGWVRKSVGAPRGAANA